MIQLGSLNLRRNATEARLGLVFDFVYEVKLRFGLQLEFELEFQLAFDSGCRFEFEFDSDSDFRFGFEFKLHFFSSRVRWTWENSILASVRVILGGSRDLGIGVQSTLEGILPESAAVTKVGRCADSPERAE